MGKLTISLDFELGWGAIESEKWEERQRNYIYEDFRIVFKRFLSLLDDLEIPLTWATVGAMISNPTKTDFEHLPPVFMNRAVQFLNNAKPLTKDGRDLFESLLNMRTQQDIGLHSFSHTRFLEESFSVESKLVDLKKGQQSLLKYGVQPKSFVFPVNQVSNLDLLSQVGIEVARIPPKISSRNVGKLSEALLGQTPTARRCKVQSDLYTEAGSMLFNWRGKKLRKLLINHQVGLGLSKATRSDYHFHLWLHPFNLAEIPGLESGLYKLLKKAAGLRDEGKIDIVSMSEIRECH